MYYKARWYDNSLGRFSQADTIVPGAGDPRAWDRYSYSRNSPIRYNDPTGRWIETALDIAFIAYDIYDIKVNGLTLVSGLSLVADVAGALLPVVTGAGLAVRALSHADDVIDATKAANTIVDAVQTADKVDDISDLVSHGDNLADVLSHANDLPDDALVCRAGTCLAEQFEVGTGVVRNPDGTLSNISVSSAPGKSLEELSRPFPNNQVGITTVGEVRSSGGNVVSSPSLGNPYHADLSGISAQNAELLFRPTFRIPTGCVPDEKRVCNEHSTFIR